MLSQFRSGILLLKIETDQYTQIPLEFRLCILCDRNLVDDENHFLFNVIFIIDKGSAVVLMDTENYIKEAERQLSDTDFYVITESDLTEKHIKQIEEILKEMLDKLEIEWETFIHLKPDISKNTTANFYILPKIHKKEVKVRPIMNGNGCPTEKISAFVDDHIKGFVKTLLSYIKDTTDFIRKLKLFSNVSRTQPDNELIFVTMDVTSLYTISPITRE